MSRISKEPKYIDFDGFRLPWCFSPEAFRSALNYKPKPGDLFVVTYPKCGTTWMQHIIMLIIRNGKPFMKFMDFMFSTPFLELTGADAVDLMPGPGAIKLHLPFHLTPFSPDAKYIYVARNPRDCCVSFYYHTKGNRSYYFEDGTFDDFFELFVSGETDFGDYFDHLLSWYEHKDDPNVYFVTYEDLKKDTEGNILNLAKFLGDGYYENIQKCPAILEDILRFSSFSYMKETVNPQVAAGEEEALVSLDQMKNVPSGVKALKENIAKAGISFGFAGEFVRKGIVGDWKNYFSPEQERRMEERIKEKTAGSDVMNLWKSE